ncbi:MAG: hypothetical protein HYW57_01710 [Ignavibacteriales bacterium]|nr:hypothetical protein [Ignavibacteriales bacterium]
MLKSRITVLISMVLAAVASRLIPHPPNFTPMIALALFGGSYFTDRRTAYVVPLAAMVLSDIGLAFLKGYEFFTAMRLVIYGCFSLMTTMGFLLRHRLKIVNIIAASVAGSIVFFIITNFAVWAGGHLYPMNMTGLAQCYIAAIPFFSNTVLSALFYSGLLFGSFEFAQHKIPALAESRI